MNIDWNEAPDEATHYDSRWGDWMWLDSEGDWLMYSEGSRISGWEVCYPDNYLIIEYFRPRPSDPLQEIENAKVEISM
jgi:hypothetical protein